MKWTGKTSEPMKICLFIGHVIMFNIKNSFD